MERTVEEENGKYERLLQWWILRNKSVKEKSNSNKGGEKKNLLFVFILSCSFEKPQKVEKKNKKKWEIQSLVSQMNHFHSWRSCGTLLRRREKFCSESVWRNIFAPKLFFHWEKKVGECGTSRRILIVWVLTSLLFLCGTKCNFWSAFEHVGHFHLHLWRKEKSPLFVSLLLSLLLLFWVKKCTLCILPVLEESEKLCISLSCSWVTRRLQEQSPLTNLVPCSHFWVNNTFLEEEMSLLLFGEDQKPLSPKEKETSFSSGTPPAFLCKREEWKRKKFCCVSLRRKFSSLLFMYPSIFSYSPFEFSPFPSGPATLTQT